jgi:hypothetical protein
VIRTIGVPDPALSGRFILPSKGAPCRIKRLQRRPTTHHPNLGGHERLPLKRTKMNSREQPHYEPSHHEKNPPLTATNANQNAADDEARLIRRLQIMISMVSSVICQDPSLTVEEASELAAGAKRAALAMFPDKELAYDLLYKPRLQRLMRERFRLQ